MFLCWDTCQGISGVNVNCVDRVDMHRDPQGLWVFGFDAGKDSHEFYTNLRVMTTDELLKEWERRKNVW